MNNSVVFKPIAGYTISVRSHFVSFNHKKRSSIMQVLGNQVDQHPISIAFQVRSGDSWRDLPQFQRETNVWMVPAEPGAQYWLRFTVAPELDGQIFDIVVEIDGVNVSTGRQEDREGSVLILQVGSLQDTVFKDFNLQEFRFLDVDTALSENPKAGLVRISVYPVVKKDLGMVRSHCSTVQVASFMYGTPAWVESQGVEGLTL